MPEGTHFLEKLLSEIKLSVKSERNGNPGRARVCARRAAGYILKEYYHKREHNEQLPIGIYDLIQYARQDPEFDKLTIALLDNMSIKVDENYNLPEGINIIKNVYELGNRLLDIDIKELQIEDTRD